MSRGASTPSGGGDGCGQTLVVAAWVLVFGSGGMLLLTGDDAWWWALAITLVMAFIPTLIITMGRNRNRP